MYTMEHVNQLLIKNFLDYFHFISVNLNLFQSDFNLGVLGIDILAVCCALLWLVFFCRFGNLAADRVSAIGDAAYDLNWFDYPVGLQKYLILTIARSNRRVQFSGLQLIPCSIEMFGKVSSTTQMSSHFQY